MGRWMEVISRRPSNGAAALLSEYQHDIIGEIAPNALMNAYGHLPKWLRHRFPTLQRVSRNSREYENEQLLLTPEDVKVLDREFYQLRRLCRGEETVYGSGHKFDGDHFMERWCSGSSLDDFERHLSQIEALIQRALQENAYIMMSV